MNIAILGYGTVGKGVEQLAIENNIKVAYILMRTTHTLTKTTMTHRIDDILQATDLDIVVECIGGDEPSFSLVKECLENGKSVISANKKMIAKHYQELIDIAKRNNVNFLFSSACGGGIPWLSELSRISQTDQIKEFKGIMNGTSNYILNKMYYDNLSFNEALKQAQELGYAESDPSDDIDGIDTANKVILSLGVGFNKLVKQEDMFIKGIRYFDLIDLNFIKENGYKCVLMGKGLENSVSVMPTLVKEDSIFYNIKDNYNCFYLDSKNLGPFHLIGQGAGSLPTASNVIRDIKQISNPYKVELKEELKPDYDVDSRIFYLRKKEELKSELIEKDLGHNTYITKKISINKLKTILDEKDFVGEIENA